MERFLLVVIVLLLASASSQQTSDDDDNEGSFRNDNQCITRYRLIPYNETRDRKPFKVPWAYHSSDFWQPWDLPVFKSNKRSRCRDHQWSHIGYDPEPKALYGPNRSLYRVFLMMEESYKRAPMLNPWTGEEMSPQIFGPQVLELAGEHSEIASSQQRGLKLFSQQFIRRHDAAMKQYYSRPFRVWDYIRPTPTRPYGTFYYLNEARKSRHDGLYAWKHSYNYALTRD
jgi:hypothetical protein